MFSDKDKEDLDFLRALAGLLNEEQLSEISLERKGVCFKVARQVEVRESFGAQLSQVADSQQANQAEEDMGLKTIYSPIVGTFYRSSAPGKPPFVDVGDRMANDTTVCIIEAMKTMNEVQAQLEGTLVEVLVQDGCPVEYNQPLFKVRP